MDGKTATTNTDLMSVAEALERVLAQVSPTEAQMVPVEEAAGRVLAEPLCAILTQPPFAASAMDGYGLRAADVRNKNAPVRLRVIGQAAAGHPFAGTLGPGEAVRIFTGAPLPEGADAVIMQENTQYHIDDVGFVTITDTTISPGFVRPKGMDFNAGDVLLASGRILNARELALAAASGHGAVACRRRPLVAILSTGDELVPPGTAPGPGQIVSSNHLGIAAMVTAAGGKAHYLGIARDTTDSLNAHLDRARNADILITIGGASVGDHDLVGPMLKSRGMALSFWKIAMRPGKPLMFGQLGNTRVLGLPGNPVSALVSARVFLMPLIAALLGLPRTEEETPQRARLATALPANGPRQHYLRATLTRDDNGHIVVAPVASQDSSLLSLFTRADCLMVRAAGDRPRAAGEMIEILKFDG